MDKKCVFPGCLCSIPSCPCHQEHPDPETWGTGDPVWESAMLRDTSRAANYWQEKCQRQKAIVKELSRQVLGPITDHLDEMDDPEIAGKKRLTIGAVKAMREALRE